MLSFATIASASLIVPFAHIPAVEQRAALPAMPVAAKVATHSNLFPTTVLLADAKIIEAKEGVKDVYAGASNSLDLAALLDDVPVSDIDPNGAKGIEADKQGMQRLKERQAKEAEEARVRYLDQMALEQKGVDTGAYPKF